MKKVLITGFEPFDQDAINPSWQVVKNLPDQIGDCQIVKLEVPVVFEKGARTILETATRVNPDAIMCCGYHAVAEKLHLEYCALNLMHARIPDNEGYQPQQERIVPEGPFALQTRLPVFELEKLLNEQSIPAVVSYSAGTFVCNDVMYRILCYCQAMDISGGFIHIPSLSEKTLSLDTAVQGLGHMVKALFKS